MKSLYSKLLDIVVKIGLPISPDKLQHFVACLIAPIFLGMYGFAFSIGAGLGVEYKDSITPGNKWSWGDLVADLAGALTGLVINYLLIIQ